MHTRVGGSGEAGTSGQVAGGSALQQTEWARGRADGRRAGSESAGQWGQRRPAGRRTGVWSSDGTAGPGLGRILKQPSAPRHGRQRRPGEERWKLGGRPAVRPAGLGFAAMLRGLGSHSEELNATPCGRSAPLCSPHVLS